MLDFTCAFSWAHTCCLVLLLAHAVGCDVESTPLCQPTSRCLCGVYKGQAHMTHLLPLRGGFQKGLDPSALMKSITRNYANEELQKALQQQIQKQIEAKVQSAVAQNMLQVWGLCLRCTLILRKIAEAQCRRLP